MFFQTLKRFLTSFSILFNFQGPVRLSLAADDLFILPPKWFFVKPYFLEAFELSELGHPRSFSEQTGTFSASIGSFQGLPAGASEVILLPQRLALKYNTTPPPPCQHFLTDFFHSFLRAPQNSSRLQEKLRRSCIAAAAAKAEESSPGTIQVFRIFAGSARLQQPAWAAFRSGQWVPDPIHSNSCLPGSSKPQTALPPH